MGVTFEEDQSESKKKTLKEFKGQGFRFGAPEEYEHLSKDERKELTRHMMGRHKNWRAVKKVLLPKEPVKNG